MPVRIRDRDVLRFEVGEIVRVIGVPEDEYNLDDDSIPWVEEMDEYIGMDTDVTDIGNNYSEPYYYLNGCDGFMFTDRMLEEIAPEEPFTEHSDEEIFTLIGV